VSSCNHYCSVKTISITYSERVIVDFGTQNAMRMRHIAVCGLPGSTKFSALSPKLLDFRKKKTVLYIICVLRISVPSQPCDRSTAISVHYTKAVYTVKSAAEDGRVCRPKHVDQIQIDQ